MKTEDWTLRELVSAALALVLVGFAIFLMWHIAYLASGSTAEEYQRLSSLLQVAVGLAGTATGYYFGRVPAEKSAAAARVTASEAQKSLADVTQKAGQRLESVDHTISANRTAAAQLTALRNVMAGGTPLGGAGDPSSDRKALVARIDSVLETLK